MLRMQGNAHSSAAIPLQSWARPDDQLFEAAAVVATGVGFAVDAAREVGASVSAIAAGADVVVD